MSQGPNDDKLIAARVRVTVNCPECASPVPVNGLIGQVLCGACQSVVPLKEDLSWDRILTYASHESCMEHRILVKTEKVKSMDYFLAFGPKGGALYRDYRHILLEVDTRPPACTSCKEPLSLEALGREVAEEGREVDAFCPACGAQVPIRVPTRKERNAIHEACVAVVNESAVKGDLHEPETAEHVLFSCMGCGAPLDIDGSSKRMHTCSFCDATNYLPDALWLRLHPAQRKQPFYFLLRSNSKIHAQAKRKT